jgi:hypothetical protein
MVQDLWTIVNFYSASVVSKCGVQLRASAFSGRVLEMLVAKPWPVTSELETQLMAGGLAQAVDHLPCKSQSPEFKPLVPPKKKKTLNKWGQQAVFYQAF